MSPVVSEGPGSEQGSLAGSDNQSQDQSLDQLWMGHNGFSLLTVGPGLQDGMKGPDEPAASPLLHLKCGKRAQLWQELGLSCDACLAPGFQFIQGREGPILSSILETNEAPC